MRDNTGFTLIELMVVLAIIATMVAVGIPNFLAYMPNARLKSAARELYSNLQLAKMGAIKHNTDWAIVFDKAGGKYQVCSGQGGDSAWSGTNDVEETVVLSDYGYGVSYGHSPATLGIDGGGFGDEITYTGPDNVAVLERRGTSTAGYVYLKNAENTVYGVGTGLNGVVKLRRWTGSDWEE